MNDKPERLQKMEDGWESRVANRKLIYTDSLVQSLSDTTLHWVNFDQDLLGGISDPDLENIPQQSQLHQNFPNPFNIQTMIRYGLREPGFITLKIYDVRGRLVTKLFEEHQQPGNYIISWDAWDDSGSALPSGIYYILLQTGANRFSKKMLLIK